MRMKNGNPKHSRIGIGIKAVNVPSKFSKEIFYSKIMRHKTLL